MTVKFFGVRGLKLEKLHGLLAAKSEEEKQKPDVIVLHCGTNDINPHTNVNMLLDKISTMTQKLFLLAKSMPGTKLVWSNVLGRIAYKGMPIRHGTMLTNNMNAAAQMCMLMHDHVFVEHNNIDPRKIKLFRKSCFTRQCPLVSFWVQIMAVKH